jgi:SAM-dependent methyltransferase
VTRPPWTAQEREPSPADGHRERNGVDQHFESLALSGAWDGLYDTPETSANVSFRVRLSRALDLLPHEASSVLDVGCGPAPLAPLVLERGARYVGVDIVQPMLLRARLREPRARLVRADFALPFKDATFDAVVALGFVEYLPDVGAAFREMRRVVRPQGTVVVSTPKRLHLDQLLVHLTWPLRRAAAAVWGRRSDSVPRTLLQPAELDHIAQTVGLRLVCGTHYHFTPLPYPLTVVLPELSLRATRVIEGWKRHQALSWLAHGYLGSYRRD